VTAPRTSHHAFELKVNILQVDLAVGDAVLAASSVDLIGETAGLVGHRASFE
jgi:hypothetical protein